MDPAAVGGEPSRPTARSAPGFQLWASGFFPLQLIQAALLQVHFFFFNIFHQVHFKRESYWDGYFIGWNIRIYRVAATRRLRATFILGQSFAANY